MSPLPDTYLQARVHTHMHAHSEHMDLHTHVHAHTCVHPPTLVASTALPNPIQGTQSRR